MPWSTTSGSPDTRIADEIQRAAHNVKTDLVDVKSIFSLFNPVTTLKLIWDIWYQVVQFFIILFFKPPHPTQPDELKKPFGKVAVIGAGLTGVSSAAHCVAHNFEVALFDQNPSVGGIWSHVNSTSGLQINSLIYRFHPAVFWSRAFPQRDEILGEITRVWKEYQLESCTRLNRTVTKVERKSKEPSQWIIHSKSTAGDDEGHEYEEGPFNAVIVTVGTCGEPNKSIQFEGREGFEDAGGWVVHSSELDTLTQSSDEGESAGADEHEHEKATGAVDGDANGGNANGNGDEFDSYEGQDEESETEEHEHEPPVDLDQDPNFDGVESVIPVERDTRSHKEKRKDKQAYHDQQPEGHGHGQRKSSRFEARGKEVVIIGSGASGVEAAEWAISQGAKCATILARDDKWIIPRNLIFDTLLSAQPFGREMPLSFIPEWFIKKFHYRDLADALAPTRVGLFEGTPVVNDTFLSHVRAGRAKYIRCDTERFTNNGVIVNVGGKNSKPGDEGEEREVKADVVVLATGFKKPGVDFLPEELFPEGYERPNLYLQNFSTEDWSILMTNSAYQNAIGTVGHFHIGIYTRILLTLLLDENARPLPKDMKLWVDVLRFVKRGARGGALSFFTYMELTIWLVLFHLFRPDRIRWMFFIMQGWGVYETTQKLHRD